MVGTAVVIMEAARGDMTVEIIRAESPAEVSSPSIEL